MIIIFWKPFAAHQLVHLETHLVQHACQASLLLSIHRCDHFIQPCRWIDWGVPGCFDLRTHFGAYPLLWCLLWYIMFIFVTGLLGLKCYEGSCGIFGIPCPAKYYLKFLQYLMLFKSISVSFLDKRYFGSVLNYTIWKLIWFIPALKRWTAIQQSTAAQK